MLPLSVPWKYQDGGEWLTLKPFHFTLWGRTISTHSAPVHLFISRKYSRVKVYLLNTWTRINTDIGGLTSSLDTLLKIRISVLHRTGITLTASILYWLHFHQFVCTTCNELSVSRVSMLSAENTQTYSSSVNFVKRNSKHHVWITLLVIKENRNFRYASISGTSHTDVHFQHSAFSGPWTYLESFVNVTIL
jgi:hypothetical protein